MELVIFDVRKKEVKKTVTRNQNSGTSDDAICVEGLFQGSVALLLALRDSCRSVGI